ncbi:MAG: ABC-F family ATP-binding cassette domain-containing protein [Candidatus Limnocylindria bacterium]
MSVLSVQAVARRYADRLVFGDVSFRLAHGDRSGLVGPNGCGKTSLLRIAAGVDEADAGTVAVARGTRIGFLEQELLVDVDGSVEDHARGAATHLRALEAELRGLEATLHDADQEALERYADAQHHFEHAGGYDFDATVSRVLGGLGLTPLADRQVRTLSGGERTRLGLARLLLDDPDVLLLDEPTNHLDLAALEWLETFLVEQELTVLVSSHDRWFLDRVTSRTLSFEHGTVVEYRGGYTRYARQRTEREEAQSRVAERQAQEIARQRAFIDKHRADQLSKQSRGRAKQLARLDRVEAPEQAAEHTWRLEAAHLAGDVVIETTPLAVGHRDHVVLRTPGLRVERGARIAVAGANGAGKKTLVRTLVGDLPSIGGYVSSAPTARVAFLAQAQAELMGDESVLESLRTVSRLDEESARGILARFLFRGEDVFRTVGVLSGGERTRLALARLSVRNANLLVLDEPTNHLDLGAREALETVLGAYEGTTIFVSHDRYFIDKLATGVWLIADGALVAYDGNWSAVKRGDAPLVRASDVSTAPGPAGRAAGPAPSSRAASMMALRRTGSPHGPPSAARRSGAKAPAPAAPRSPDQPDTAAPRSKSASRRPTSSRPRKVEGTRALEARIESMELQLRQLEKKVAEIAQAGNYLETRRVGEEHAATARALRELYDEWARNAETTQ